VVQRKQGVVGGCLEKSTRLSSYIHIYSTTEVRRSKNDACSEEQLTQNTSELHSLIEIFPLHYYCKPTSTMHLILFSVPQGITPASLPALLYHLISSTAIGSTETTSLPAPGLVYKAKHHGGLQISDHAPFGYVWCASVECNIVCLIGFIWRPLEKPLRIRPLQSISQAI
jgi:hypothetical protein